MSEPEIRQVRYVFLDVVGFTRNRSVEAQAHVICALNDIVKRAAAEVACDETIFLPTGDGVCIELVGDSSFDAHL